MEGTELNWRKSSYSGNGGGECVEIGASPGAVVVRDTTDPTGPVLRFTPAAWRRFADQVKRLLAAGLTLRPAGAALVSGSGPYGVPEVPRQVGPLQPGAVTVRTVQGPRRGVGLRCTTR